MEIEKLWTTSIYRLSLKEDYILKVRFLGDPTNYEAEIYSLLDHPSIVKYYGRFPPNDFQKEKIPQIKEYLLLDYIEGYPLRYLEYHPDLDVLEVEFTIQWLFNMIFYLHRKHVSHNDLHLNNILRSYRGTLYLIDFEKSEIVPHNQEISSLDIELGIKIAYQLLSFVKKGVTRDLKLRLDRLGPKLSPLECCRILTYARL